MLLMRLEKYAEVITWEKKKKRWEREIRGNDHWGRRQTRHFDSSFWTVGESCDMWASTTWEEAALASTEKRGWKWVGSWGDPSFLDIFVFKILKTWPKLSLFFPFYFFNFLDRGKALFFFIIIIVCRDGDILFFNSFYLSLKKKKLFFLTRPRRIFWVIFRYLRE